MALVKALLNSLKGAARKGLAAEAKAAVELSPDLEPELSGSGAWRLDEEGGTAA